MLISGRTGRCTLASTLRAARSPSLMSAADTAVCLYFLNDLLLVRLEANVCVYTGESRFHHVLKSSDTIETTINSCPRNIRPYY